MSAPRPRHRRDNPTPSPRLPKAAGSLASGSAEGSQALRAIGRGWDNPRCRRGPIAGTLLLLLSAGCGSTAALRSGAPRKALPLPPEMAAYYDYPDHSPKATRELLRVSHGVREQRVRFPLSATGFEPTEPVVEIEWFQADRPGRRPAILFNPILGGDYPLERGICLYLARHGFHVALIHRKTLKIAPEHGVAHIELLLRQGVLRMRQAVDWMGAQEEVDPARLGSFGISMGGIASALAAAVEPRLKVHVIGLAGGSIADILVATHDPLLAKPRSRYLAARRLRLSELDAELRRAVVTDPIRLAPYVDPSRILMIMAGFDRTIGRANALRLWQALGRPRAVTLPLGHYTSYLALPYVKRISLRQFQREL